MPEHKIKCPHCGKPVEIAEAVTTEVEQRLRDEFNAKFKSEMAKREEKLRKEAEERAALEQNLRLKDIESQLQAQTKRAKTAEEKEIALLRRQREIEEQAQTQALELERKLLEQSGKIREETEAKFADNFRLKEAEKEKLITDMRKQLDEMRRKADQGSQQTQGEVFELELESLLLEKFRYDDIRPVPKGTKGADVIQQVRAQSGSACGTIIWESKRTKAWSQGWVTKLKDDQRSVNASIAVIVSTVLPPEIKRIGNIEGVWVTDFDSAFELASVLRAGLMELSQAKQALEGKNEKMELLYAYLSGQEFRHRVEAVVESFAAMKEDLDAEKRSFEKIWQKREKQIERVVSSMSRMHGDLEGIMGGALQPVAVLELPLNDRNND